MCALGYLGEGPTGSFVDLSTARFGYPDTARSRGVTYVKGGKQTDAVAEVQFQDPD